MSMHMELKIVGMMECLLNEWMNFVILVNYFSLCRKHHICIVFPADGSIYGFCNFHFGEILCHKIRRYTVWNLPMGNAQITSFLPKFWPTCMNPWMGVQGWGSIEAFATNFALKYQNWQFRGKVNRIFSQRMNGEATKIHHKYRIFLIPSGFPSIETPLPLSLKCPWGNY